MNLMPHDEHGLVYIEGQPGEAFMARDRDVDRLLEACFAASATAALLYAANMPPAFFDISSQVAGAILQKLRNYRIRLALVCPAGSVTLSSRFGELVADEKHGTAFGLFESREAASDWLLHM